MPLAVLVGCASVRPATMVLPDGLAAASSEVVVQGLGGGRPGEYTVAGHRGSSNSIHRWTRWPGMTVFSRRTLGQEAARLDQPVDVVVRGDEVIVSNWTSTGRTCVLGRIPITQLPPETNKGAKP